MDPESSTVEHLERALAHGFADLLTPALVVDLDAVAHNVRAMISHVGDAARWRPHLKTNKQAIVISDLLTAGVHHFKVATLDELDLLLATARRAGAPTIDVLLAYPLHGAAFAAFVELRERYADSGSRVSTIADSPEHARMIDARLAGRPRARPLPILLDVDLGMNRTGTAPADWSEALAGGLLGALPSCELVGLHGYDGHFCDGDRDAAWRAYDCLCALARSLPEHRRPPNAFDLVTSGTHSFGHALAHAGLRDGPWRAQVSPGTIVFGDRRSHAAVARLGLRQAAFVATRVVSRAPGRLTLDAGSKAISPDGSPPTSHVLGWPGVMPGRASEEHLPCALESGFAAPPLGGRVWLVPDHVCTTVNLHREAIWVRGDVGVGWGPVEAAGHRCWPPGSPRRGGVG